MTRKEALKQLQSELDDLAPQLWLCIFFPDPEEEAEMTRIWDLAHRYRGTFEKNPQMSDDMAGIVLHDYEFERDNPCSDW